MREDGVIAGTVLTMIDAVRNLHALGISFEDAVGAATTVPARIVGRTDLGTLEKVGGDELVLTAVPHSEGTTSERIDAARAACGWDLGVAADVRELDAPTADEIAALRRWDPRGWFLRAR